MTAAPAPAPIALAEILALLPEGGWRSHSLGIVANTHIKLFRVDPDGLAEEAHPDWAEAVVMIEGGMRMTVDGAPVTLTAGDVLRIPEGSRHAILPGGHGAFLLIDPEGLV